MPVYGKVVVIRRNGSDGSKFPITSDSCLFGRSQDCDIRVQLPYVSNEQCRIRLNETGEFVLQNISKSNKTVVNKIPVSDDVKLSNKDIITVVDRSFRFEYPENSPFFHKKFSQSSDGLKSTSSSDNSVAKRSAQIDSPFGKLVNDMKTMISNGTPLRQRNDGKEKTKTSKSSLIKKTSVQSADTLQPEADNTENKVYFHRRSTKKSSSGPKIKKKSSLQNQQTFLSVDMLNVAMIEKYASSDAVKSVEKENIVEQRKSKRLSGQSFANNKKSLESRRSSVSPKQEATSLEATIEKQNISDHRKSKRLSAQRLSNNRKSFENIAFSPSAESPKLQALPISKTSNEKERNTCQKFSKTLSFQHSNDEPTDADKHKSTPNSSKQQQISVMSAVIEKENNDQQKNNKRLSVRRSSNNEKPSGVEVSAAIEKQSNDQHKNSKGLSAQHLSSNEKPIGVKVSNSAAKSQKHPAEFIAKISEDFDLSSNPNGSNDEFPASVTVAKNRRRSEPVIRKVPKKQTTNKKKSSKNRSSLPQMELCGSRNDNEKGIVSSFTTESISSSLNSSESVGVLDVAMITESITSTDSFENSSQTEVSGHDQNQSRRKSTRSSLDNKTSSIIESPNFKQTSISPTSAKDETPSISLTSVHTTPDLSEDPYSFPDEDKSAASEKIKKYRRRSSGSTGLSRKQALLLFGSPRLKEVTPLRRSIGRLRKSSEPIIEDCYENDSPKQSQSLQKSSDSFVYIQPNKNNSPMHSPKLKKNFAPLPQVEEIENNSSPIKKPSSALQRRSSVHNRRAISVSRKSHRVSFGPNLSPEQFLKNLPPNTPVKKGATPSKSNRKSLTVGNTTPLSLVAETQEKIFKSPVTKNSPQNQKKVDRTPTPFKPDPKKLKGKSLLQQVLHASIANNKRLEQDSTSPKLAKKRKSTDIDELKAKKTKQENDAKDVPGIKKKVQPSPKRRGNTPIVSVHKTARNLQRRSIRSAAKPLWSEIVKRPAKNQVGKKIAKKTAVSKQVSKSTKSTKSILIEAARSEHHVDSPATMYISRTRSRIQPTKTPKAVKSAAPVKLDIPANEDFTGVSELFATPSTPIDLSKNDDTFLSLITPKSVGEMLVSPMSDEDQSHYDLSLSGDSSLSDGASPEFKKTRRSKNRKITKAASKNLDPVERHAGQKRLMKSPKEKSAASQVEEYFGTKKIFKTPIEAKSKTVRNDNFGTKRIFKTPRGAKCSPIRDHFGTKRLLKTPKEAKSQPVEDHFGTKRLLRTPKEAKSQPVEDHFGTRRLLKTPRAAKSQPVEDHFGTKRLLRTPREPKSQPVEDHFGTKRLLKTPRPAKSQPVENHFGTKRLLTTPREPKAQPVEDHFGTRRLLRTPREAKSQPVENNFGTKRMFTTPKEKNTAVEEHFGTKRLFKTPREAKSKPVESCQTTTELDSKDLHLDFLFSASDESKKIETPLKETLAASSKPALNHSTRNTSKSLTTSSQKGLVTATVEERRASRRCARTKKDFEKSSRTLTVDADEECSSLNGDSSVVKAKATKTRQSNRIAKSSTSKIFSSLIEEREPASAEPASPTTRSKKHVTFHASVKSSLIADSPQKVQEIEKEKKVSVEETLLSDKRRSRKRTAGVVENEEVVAASVRRGRSKTVVEQSETALVEPTNGTKAAKKRRVNKSDEESNTVTDEGLDASDGSTGKLAPKRTSKTGRKKQGKQDINMDSVKETETRSTRAKRTKKQDQVESKSEESKMSTVKTNEVRSTRTSRSKTKEEQSVDNASENVTSEKSVPVKRGIRNRRGAEVDSEDVAEFIGLQSSDVSAITRSNRRKANQKTVEEAAVTEIEKPKSVKTSGRRGKTQKAAEAEAKIKPVVTKVEKSKLVKKSGRRVKAQKVAEVEENAEADLAVKKVDKRSTRNKRGGKVAEQSGKESVSSQSSGISTAASSRSQRKSGNKNTSTFENVEAEKGVPVKRSNRNKKGAEVQKNANDEESMSPQSGDALTTTRSARSRTNQKKQVEETSETVAVEKSAPVKRGTRSRKAANVNNENDEESVCSQSSDVSTTRSSRSKANQKKSEETTLMRSNRKRNVEEVNAGAATSAKKNKKVCKEEVQRKETNNVTTRTTRSRAR